MFVLLVLGLLYSYVKNTCRDPEKEWKWSLKDVLLQPQIIAAGFLIGVFHWSNYWDFIIYFVVIAGFSLYGALYRYHARAKETIGTVLLQAAEVFAIGTIVALPFTMKFETMVSGCRHCQAPFDAVSAGDSLGPSDGARCSVYRSRSASMAEKLSSSGHGAAGTDCTCRWKDAGRGGRAGRCP